MLLTNPNHPFFGKSADEMSLLFKGLGDLAETARRIAERKAVAFVDPPADFPFANDAELALVDYWRGRRFAYRSKYGGTMVLTVRSVVVLHEHRVNTSTGEYDIYGCRVKLATDKSSYDWADCKMLPD